MANPIRKSRAPWASPRPQRKSTWPHSFVRSVCATAPKPHSRPASNGTLVEPSHSAAQATWQQRTNVWRKVTRPARGPKLQRSGDGGTAPWRWRRSAFMVRWPKLANALDLPEVAMNGDPRLMQINALCLPFRWISRRRVLQSCVLNWKQYPDLKQAYTIHIPFLATWCPAFGNGKILSDL